MTQPEPRYTIDELGARAAAALASGYRPSGNGQVRPIPARRSIRYYTTLGVLDRPAEIRGRTAYYGLRHLRQLVAIKRLQAQGWSLGRIQARLAVISDAELATLAALPEAVEPARSAVAQVTGPTRDQRGAFWRELPDPPSQARPSSAEPPAGRMPAPLVGLALEPGIWLQVEGAGELSARDARALRRAARPLIDALYARGLIAAPAADWEETE